MGFFAYPWDLLDEGIDIALDTMAERCHCSAIALNASYHSARLLRPRMNGPVTCQRPGAMVAFIPDPSRYEAGAPLPAVDRRLTGARVLERTRESCAARNVDFGLWVVGLHNSTLGNADPELCMLNCFGDIYTYSLCPANPRARAYLRGLVTDVCAQFHPQRILLEAIGYLGIQHGVHHELFMHPLSEAERRRLEKLKASVQARVKAVEKTLHNPAFRARAPHHVVQQRMDTAEDLRAQLTKIIQNLADLE